MTIGLASRRSRGITPLYSQQELTERHPEDGSNPHQGREAQIRPAVFNGADVRSVDVDQVSKLFLAVLRLA